MMRHPYTRDREMLLASQLFDAKWYLRKHRDVALAKLDPLDHYLQFGGREQRDPGPYFRTGQYLARRPDVRAAEVNPLIHFLRSGLLEIGDDLTAYGIGPFHAVDEDGRPSGAARRRKTGRKAVFVTHDVNVGGAPRVLAKLARWFNDHTDYDVRIVAMAGGPWLEQLMDVAPVHIVGHINVADGDVPILRDALREFIGEEPAFTFINSAAAGHYCKLDPFNAPRFAYVHEMPKILDMYRDQAELLFRRSRHVFCGGKQVYNGLIERGIADAELLSVRPAFVDDNVGDVIDLDDKARRKAGFGWKPETRIVMACGIAHWRKQPEVFVRLAGRLAGELERDARFVWVGDGEDLPKMRKLADELGVGDRLELLGNREDFPALVAAADVFALTSSEDPFPLVCLEAALASVPSVVFREATSFSDVINADPDAPAGFVVPLGDEDAFFAAVDTLISDDTLRSAHARAARANALADYTTEAAGVSLLRQIRTMAGLPPRISAVLPSYNCGPYLQQRLDSIAEQSFRDMEILLLDDVSTDNSVEILQAFADGNPDAKLVVAEKNSGSVFKAWQRGIEMAKGDIVWLCEADDFAEPDFVEKAMAGFGQSGVRLVHGRSIPVDSDGEIAGDWNDLYLDQICEGRWRASYTAPAAREVRTCLGFANTIPNGSAVLVLREAAQRAIPVATGFRLAGDWAFYLTAIAGGRISYCHEAVNYHRRHQRSVTHGIEGTDRYFQEFADIGAITERLYGPDAARDAKLAGRMASEAKRFNYKGKMPAGQVPATLARREPGILYGVGDLSGGGAQMYAIRFVNGWVERGNDAVLFVAGHEADHAESLHHLSPEVPVVTPVDIEEAGGFAAFIRDWGITMAVSGHWWADYRLGAWIDAEKVTLPWLIVMHGCYESVLENRAAFQGVDGHFDRAQRLCSHWVWTADKNRRLFDEKHVAPRATSHIANGFRPAKLPASSRKDLGLPDDAFLFTLASRAIESKGWLTAIEAIKLVRAASKRDAWLVLIGDGPVASQLGKAAAPEGVLLVGHTSRLGEYIAQSDVGMLPSWFVGESLPLVVIEFLAQQKPVIVADIGKCAWAVEGDAGKTAGTVVPRTGPDATVAPDVLAEAMLALMNDRIAYTKAADQAAIAFRKFDFDTMMGRFSTVMTKLASAA